MVDAILAPARRNFYVYALLRENGVPFYIGKGSGRRCWDHLKPPETDLTPKAKIIRRILRSGAEVEVRIVASGLSEADAFALERAQIAAIGRHPVGPLWNLTDGGEGSSGYKHTDEARAAIARSAKGVHGSALGRLRRSQISRDAWRDPDAAKIMRDAIQASITPDVRARMARQLKITLSDPAWRAEQSARLKAAWSRDPERRETNGRRFKATLSTPEAKARAREAALSFWAKSESRDRIAATWTPERRAAQAERARAACAARWAKKSRVEPHVGGCAATD